MSSSIVLLRHGRDSNNSLTPLGIEQTGALAERLHQLFAATRVGIFSSTVKRAVQSAEIIATRFGGLDVIQLFALGRGDGHTDPEDRILASLRERLQQDELNVIIGATHLPAIEDIFTHTRDRLRWRVDRMPFQGEAMALNFEAKSLTII